MIGSEFSKLVPIDTKEYRHYMNRRNNIIESWKAQCPSEIYDVDQESASLNVYTSGLMKQVVDQEVKDEVQYVMPEDQMAVEVLVPTEGVYFSESNDLSRDVNQVYEQNTSNVAEEVTASIDETLKPKLNLKILLGLGAAFLLLR